MTPQPPADWAKEFAQETWDACCACDTDRSAIAAALMRARNEALEEAANAIAGGPTAFMKETGVYYARIIRALKGKNEST